MIGKYTHGFTRFWPSVGTVAAMIHQLGLLGIAMKPLPVGAAYAIRVGIGAIGTVMLAIVLLGEPANALRIVSLALIVAAIICLKLGIPVSCRFSPAGFVIVATARSTDSPMETDNGQERDLSLV